MNRKFDIRQWIMVTDWNPLTVWIYKECYIRFASVDYSNKTYDKFVHLTNHSIGKNSKNYCESEIEGNMWSCGEF